MPLSKHPPVSDSTADHVRPSLHPSMPEDKMYIVMYIEEDGMAKRHSIAEARSNLPNLVREAESGKVVELTRHGKLVAVLMGSRQYEQLTSGFHGFADAYGHFTSEFDLQGLAIDPDEVFGGARDDTAGREVRL